MDEPNYSAHRKRGKIFVISAPSGCGKTTLRKRLLNDKLGLSDSISMTTRRIRPGERDGVDYLFVSKGYFRDMIKRKGFLECEENFGAFYGTPKKFVAGNLKKNKPVLLSIDVKGAMKVRKAYPKDSVLIFILPPSMAALKKRLRSRRSDAPAAISARLKRAKDEISYKDKYDYVIINDSLGRAYGRLKKVVTDELYN